MQLHCDQVDELCQSTAFLIMYIDAFYGVLVPILNKLGSQVCGGGQTNIGTTPAHTTAGAPKVSKLSSSQNLS